MRTLRHALVFAIGVSILIISVAIAQEKKSSPSVRDKQIARGKYIVEIAGCHDCHTPKVKDAPPMTLDENLLLSGRPQTTMPSSKPNDGEATTSLDLTAWHGPWGVSYTANLTPDAETGIGKRYTEAAFIKTIRTGVKPEGEPLLPPMPWQAYRHMTDDDLKAVYAYLQTVKPVKNFVRSAAPMPTTKN